MAAGRNYVPCWDQECETLYRSFIRVPVGIESNRAASWLLYQLEQKKQERWGENDNSVDLSHSSRNVWSTIIKLTGGSEHASCLCPISANSITSQLVKNGLHRTGGHGSTRFFNKELSDVWKIPTPEGHSISEGRRSLAVPLDVWSQESLWDWTPSSRSLVHTPRRVGSQVLVCDFLTSCLRQLTISKIWRRPLIVAIPKPEKPSAESKSYRPISLLCVTFKILERLIYTRVVRP